MPASLTDASVLDALRPIVDPDFGKSIVDLGFVKDLAHRRRERLVHDRAHDAGLSREGGVREGGSRARGGASGCQLRRGDDDREHARPRRRPEHADGRGAAGRAQHDRRGFRQGRRRQEHDRGQPRDRAARDGRPRRADGRRRLRTVAAPAHRRPRPTALRAEAHLPAAGTRPLADVDGVLRHRELARDLARADGARLDPSVPDGRRMGRARLSGGRHAAGHRRRRAHADAAGAARRRGDRDDRERSLADRRAQGPQDVREGAGPRARDRREHVVLHAARSARPQVLPVRPRRGPACRGRARRTLPRRGADRPARGRGR